MKNKYFFVVLLATLLVGSCDKEKDEFEGITRYAVKGAVPAAAASLIDRAIIYEYNIDDIRIDSNVINEPHSGKTYMFFPSDSVNHLKLKLISKANTYRWGDTIFKIIPQEKVMIKISINASQTQREPRLND